MLLTDSPAIAVEDLADHETGILDTANSEGINLTVKIVLAINEVGLQLLSRFPQLGLVNVAFFFQKRYFKEVGSSPEMLASAQEICPPDEVLIK